MATASENVQIMLLDLYKEDLIRRIAVYFSHAELFQSLVDTQRFKELCSDFAKDKIQFAKKLWEEVNQSPQHQQFPSTVLTFLNAAGDKRMHERLVTLGESQTAAPFQIILRNLPALLAVMDPKKIAEKLSSAYGYCPHLPLYLSYIADQKENEEANREIVRCLPDLGPDAYFNFLDAVAACGTDGEELAMRIKKMFDNDGIQLAATQKIYDLLCRGCNTFICTSDQIVTDEEKSQYFCVNTDFWKLVKFMKFRDIVKRRQLRQGVGKQTCKCGRPWGSAVIYKDIVLPVIPESAFLLRRKSCSSNEDEENITVKDWKNVINYFVPRVIQPCDLEAMKGAPDIPNFE